MKNFEAAVDSTKSKLFKEIYSILARGNKAGAFTADGIGHRSHTISDIDEVKAVTWDHILAARAAAGEETRSVDEVRKDFTMTKDSFYNPMTKIGTHEDPTTFSAATIPVAIGPFEATSIYSSGGIAEIIINKKAKGVTLNGYRFVSENKDIWTEEKLTILKDRLNETGFVDKLSDTMRDGFLYGGGVLYPVFVTESGESFGYEPKELLKKGLLHKGCISRWVEVDRWNTVLVPGYNVSAADYMSARSYYVPLSGIEVNTGRSAIIKPKRLPYWGAIRQMGWGVSDLEGYMRSIIGYEMSIASIPLMAQQMSLLLYEMPLDTLFSQLGVDAVKKLMAENTKQMSDWSMANPKVLNAFGKVYTVNRQYSGYPDLMLTMRQDIAAQSGIPESVLFHTQPKGFSNNTEEVLLKESQTVKLAQQAVLPSLETVIPYAVIHAFGEDSQEARFIKDVHFSFDTPVVATDSERAETSARFAAAVNSLRQAGVPITSAINITQQFFHDIKISQEDMEMIKMSRRNTTMEYQLANAQAAQNLINSAGGNNAEVTE
jgi:hypothetical protein